MFRTDVTFATNSLHLFSQVYAIQLWYLSSEYQLINVFQLLIDREF